MTAAEEIKRALRDIGLALNAAHNTVASDEEGGRPVAGRSWRIDHSKEIAQVHRLEALLTSSDTCPVCGRCSIST